MPNGDVMGEPRARPYGISGDSVCGRAAVGVGTLPEPRLKTEKGDLEVAL